VSSAAGTWLTGLSLRELRISTTDGSLVIAIDSLGATYDLLALTRGELRFENVRLVRPMVVTGYTAGGDLEFLHPFSSGPDVEGEPDTSEGLKVTGASLEVTLGEFFLHSAADSTRLTLNVSKIQIAARGISLGGEIALTLDTLSAAYRPRPDALESVQIDLSGALSGDLISIGTISVRGSRTDVRGGGSIALPFDTLFTRRASSFTLEANPIAYRDLHPLVSGFGPEGEASVRVSLMRDSLRAAFSAVGGFAHGGSFEATGSAESQAPGEPSIQADVRTSELSIAAITGRADTTERISVLARLSGQGTSPEAFTGTLTGELKARGLVGSRTLHAAVEAALIRGAADVRGRGTLDALQVTLDGRVSAFTTPPAYDLTATLEIPRSAPGSPPDDLLGRLEGLRTTVQASGRGFDPVTGTSRATVRADWDGNPHVKSLALDASSRDTVAIASANLATHEGHLRLDAQADFGASETITLRSMEFQRLDLSELLGTQGSASLTGSASGFIRGTDPATMTAMLSVRLDSSLVGTTRITRGEIEARAENGVIRAAVIGETSDGHFNVQASAEPFSNQPSLTVQDARFEGLDLGGLFLNEDGATDLNGSARAHIVVEPGADQKTGSAPASQQQRRQGLVGDLQIDLRKSRVYRQEIVSAAIVGELTGQVAAVELDLRTPRGGVLASGSVEPFQAFPDIRLSGARIEHLDIGALAGIDSLDTDINGTLSVDLQGDSWETASGTIALDLLPSRINREPINEARVAADLAGSDMSLRSYASLRAGSLSIVASGSYVDDRLSFSTNTGLDLHDLSRLTRDSSLARSGANINITAEGVWGAPEITHVSGRVLADGSLDSLRVESLVTALSVVGRTIEVDSLLVRSNSGVIRGAGTIAAFDTTGVTESDFTLTGSFSSLHHLRRVSGVEFSSTGTAQLSASLTGTGKSGILALSASISNLTAEGILVPTLEARGSARLGVGPLIETMNANVMSADVAIGDIVFDSIAARAATEETAASFQSTVILESGEAVFLAGKGERLGDGYGITMDSLKLNMGDRLWILEEPAHIAIGRGIAVDGLSIASGSRRISAHGVLDPEGQQDFVLQVDSLAFDRIARLLKRPNLGGELSFSGLVSGPANNARATGRLDAHITSGGTPVGTFEADADWEGGLASITSVITQPDRTQLKAILSLPAPLPILSRASPTPAPVDGAIDTRREFALQTDGFDLKFLEPFLGSDAANGYSGLLTADVTLQGRAGSFSGTGHVAIDTGSVRANSLGVVYSDIHLRASVQGPSIAIDTFSVRTGQGGMTASGLVSLASPDNPALDLLSRLNKFVAINTRTVRAVADGSVQVAGTLGGPVITGDITVDEANFVVPETAGAEQIENVALTDADYAILRERFGYRRPASDGSGDSDTLRVSLDVGLHFPRKSWIRKKANPSLSVEIEGDLNVRSTPGEPLSLVGTLKPVPGRSYVSQFGRQFEIKSGEIRFDRSPEDFTMNVDSEYKVPARSGSGMSEATIRMRVERKLERFEFNLSSDPPMEQADILSYLTTGTASTGAFASTSSQGNLATSAALEQVVGAIGGLAEDKIPLDIFQIRQDGARGITIVAGNYITPETYLGVRYPILLQQTGQDSYYDTGTEFEVEYQSFPWLFWNAKGGSTRFIFMMKSRYAY
jgi:translocation and assembly module TamB